MSHRNSRLDQSIGKIVSVTFKDRSVGEGKLGYEDGRYYLEDYEIFQTDGAILRGSRKSFCKTHVKVERGNLKAVPIWWRNHDDEEVI